MITKRDGSLSAKHPPCKYPRKSAVRERTRKTFSPADASGPSIVGWIEYSELDAPYNGNRPWFTGLSGKVVVPNLPVQNTASDPTLYFFNGLESFDTILQPVLQRGVSPAGGGNYWSIGAWAWHFDSGVYSPLLTVSPGNTITGGIRGFNCDIFGVCQYWIVQATNTTTGVQRTLYFYPGAGENFVSALPAVLEVDQGGPPLTSCSELPSQEGTFYSETYIYQPPATCTTIANCSSLVELGANSYMNWSAVPPPPGTTPACNWGVYNVSRGTSLDY